MIRLVSSNKEQHVSLLLLHFIVLSLLLLPSFVLSGDPWVQFALQTQRNLELQHPIDQLPMIGSHNSYNFIKYPFFTPNQRLTITEQLDLGVRWLELELHYIPKLATTQQGAFRICDGSLKMQLYCTGLAWTPCTMIGIKDYGEDTGCRENSANLTSVFTEISSWISTHPRDIVVVSFRDKISITDLSRNRNIPALINQWLVAYFGGLIFTPSERYRVPSWPTAQQLLSDNNRIIFNSNKASNYGNYTIHHELRGFQNTTSSVKYFSGFPTCTSTDPHYVQLGRPDWGYFQEDQGSFSVPLMPALYNGPEQVGVFTDPIAYDVMMCGYTMMLDDIDETAVRKAVWSWAEGHPAVNQTNMCTTMEPYSGRWYSEPCFGSTRFFACVSDDDNSDWVVGNFSSVKFSSPLDESCPDGYSFSTPRSAYENRQLIEYMKKTSITEKIWLSLDDSMHEIWAPLPPSSVPPQYGVPQTGKHGTSTSSSPLDSLPIENLPAAAAAAATGLLSGLGGGPSGGAPSSPSTQSASSTSQSNDMGGMGNVGGMFDTASGMSSSQQGGTTTSTGAIPTSTVPPSTTSGSFSSTSPPPPIPTKNQPTPAPTNPPAPIESSSFSSEEISSSASETIGPTPSPSSSSTTTTDTDSLRYDDQYPYASCGSSLALDYSTTVNYGLLGAIMVVVRFVV
eukprot:TRINITY_DN3895_c0_g1_i1.p1 TRINITY_DN3895_c0_g1~~TRINITY_DN3895_c0_g1_i1.p1  ORF type:complete len:679 (+),score=183.76 TRINITY_DN3895_c0_g1_i1:66-2102(+)